jgi:hypothetical protein
MPRLAGLDDSERNFAESFAAASDTFAKLTQAHDRELDALRQQRPLLELEIETRLSNWPMIVGTLGL